MESISNMTQLGINNFIEMGPGKDFVWSGKKN